MNAKQLFLRCFSAFLWIVVSPPRVFAAPLTTIYSCDYATQVGGMYPASASTCYGWQPMNIPSSAVRLNFQASTNYSDLIIGLKYATNSYIEFVVGGWNNTQTVMRNFVNGAMVGGDMPLSGGTGRIQPNSQLQYTLSLDASSGVVSLVSAPTAGGSPTTIFNVTLSGQALAYLQQVFTAYSFKTYNTQTYYNYLTISNDSFLSLSALTSNDYAAQVGGFLPASSVVAYGWKQLSSPQSSLSMLFTATAQSDLAIGLKYADTSYLEIVLGGWSNTKTALRNFVNGAQQGGDIYVGTGPRVGGGTGMLQPNVPMQYFLTIGQGTVSVAAAPASGSGPAYLVASYSAPWLNQVISGYSFKTYNSSTYQNSLQISNVVVLQVPRGAITSNDYAAQVGGLLPALLTTPFGWQPITSSKESFKLSFTATTQSDLYIGLQYDANNWIEIALGVNNNVQGYVGMVQQGALVSANWNGSVITPNVPMVYTLTICPNPARSSSILTITAAPASGGAATTLVSTEGDFLRRTYTAYSFKTRNTPTYQNALVVSNVSVAPYSQGVVITSNDYTTAVSSAVSPATYYGWTALSAPSNRVSIAFVAKTQSDLHLALKFGPGQYLEIPIGGWSNSQSVFRIFSNGAQIGADIVVPTPGGAPIIPDVANYVSYVATIAPDLASGFGTLTVQGTTLAGVSKIVFVYKSPALNQQFTDYSFKTWNAPGYNNALYLFGASATVDSPQVFQGTVVSSNSYTQASSSLVANSKPYSWKPLSPSTNSFALSFNAATLSDVVLGLKYGDGRWFEIVIGGYGNTKSLYRTYSADGTQNLTGDILWSSSQAGKQLIIPDVSSSVAYTFTVSVDSATGSGVLNMTARGPSGATSTAATLTGSWLNQQYTAYSFRTYNTASYYNTLNLSNVVMAAVPIDYSPQIQKINAGLATAKAVIDPVVAAINDASAKLSAARAVFKTLSTNMGFSGALPF